MTIIAAGFISVVSHEAFGSSAEGYETWSWFIFDTVLMAPLIETALLQALPIYISRKFTANRTRIVTISAVLFALTHVYSVWYVLAAFPSGLLFAHSYLKFMDQGLGYWATFWAHLIHNSVAVLPVWFLSTTYY